ncbi:YlcI/YnfO family protein [Escherichia coli]|uniref:YlcI/YnfO family protein n=2 Tax=Enterobacterales TaxID=91347 RepID=UPI0016277636|nr:YlcI/YnfO family protein [Escherichia coli]
MSTKNRTRRTTTRNIRFPNQMIEQINIALDQKGSGNFSAWVIEACRRRLCSEKRVSGDAFVREEREAMDVVLQALDGEHMS